MKKLFAILVMVSLLAVTVSGLTTKREADEKDINIKEEIVTITSTSRGEYNTDIIVFDGKEYYLTAFPDKTQEQLDKMIQDPQLTVALADIPSSFSWLSFGGDWSTPARDQQNCGSCWDFAAIGALEPAINIAKGDPNFDPDLSEQYVLSCLPAAGSCSGGWMSEAIEYIKSEAPGSSGNGINGCPLESCMYYTATDYVPCDEKCTDWNYYTDPPAEDNILFQVLDFGVTSGTPSDPNYWDLMKSWILTYGPISTDIYASSQWSSFWNQNHNPTDVYQGTETGSWTNHGNTIFGWVDDNSILNGGYWIIKNTWGPSFGYQGFHNLAYGCLMLGDRDLCWVTAPAWPEAEEDPINPVYPIEHVYAGWESDPPYPKLGDEIQFHDQSRGPVVKWDWDFDGDGVIDSNEKNPEWTYYEEGTHLVYLKVWASSGLYGEVTKTVTVQEIWPPVAVSEPDYYGGEDNEVYFEGRFSYDPDGKIEGYAWDFDGDGSIDSVKAYDTHTYLDQNGEYDATLTVTDNEGATNTLVIPVKIDKTVPPVTTAIVGGVDQGDEIWFNDDVEIEIKTTDWSGVSKLYFKLDNDEWSEKYCYGARDFSGFFTLRKSKPGLHTIQFYGKDIYGNIESTKTVNVGIDLNIPSMSYVLDGDKNGEGEYITPVLVTIDANDADSGVETIAYRIDGDDWIDYTPPFTINQGGTHTVDLLVEDKAGNIVEDTFSVTLEYLPSTPIISGPSSGNLNIVYTFSFTSYDEENDQVKYYIDWGDGTNTGWSEFVNSGTTKRFTHSWSVKNEYKITAKAKDTKGAISEEAEHKINIKDKSRTLFPLLRDILHRYPILQKILQVAINRITV